MPRVRTWSLAIGVAGMALFLAAAGLAAYVYTRLPHEPGTGAGFIAVLVAWYAYCFMTVCTVIAVTGMAWFRFRTSMLLRRSEWLYLPAAAICQIVPLLYP